MTLLRSVIFFLWFAFISAVLNIFCLPALLWQDGARNAGLVWCRGVLWGLKIFAGLGYEVRGNIPPSGTLIAAKHMSMWDTVALNALLDSPVFVLQQELFNVPFYGWYVNRMGMIAIDREAGASALRKMAGEARAAIDTGRSLLIFPEGTRMLPGSTPDYKPGVAGLYNQLKQPCTPVALNSGLFWTGPGGFIKRSGKVTVEFLPAIPPGLRSRDFMAALESSIEGAQVRLLAEGRAQLAQ
jgi:1-acyl-sn-glycerol-3-phosphate acyltransferase